MRLHIQFKVSEDERELFTARNNFTQKQEQADNDYLANRQRIFGLHEDALLRMGAADNRARAIFNLEYKNILAKIKDCVGAIISKVFPKNLCIFPWTVLV